MDRPKVSVIIPSYNREKYICQNIDSLLNQSLKDIEILIIDDGSIDNTVKLINNYKDCRIKLIQNNVNQGVAAARNTGYMHALGEYIAISDSDDINHKDRLEKQSNFLDENEEYDVVTSWVQELKENHYGAIHSYECYNEAIRANWLFQPGIPSFMMFRKEKIKNKGLLYHDENYKAAVDYQWYTQLNDDIKIYCIPEVLYFYRRHKEQISTAGYKVQQQFADKIRLKQLERLEIKPSTNEFLIHSQLSNAQIDKITPKSYRKYLNWGSLLLEKNRKKRVYSETYFNSILAKRLFQVTEALGYYQDELFEMWNSSLFSKFVQLVEQDFNEEKIIKIMGNLNGDAVIVGSKRTAYYLKKNLSQYGIKIISYIDSNISIHGQEIEGIPVTGIANLKDVENLTYFISVLSEERHRIKENLINNYSINPKQIITIDDLK
jgi:glycosyltransferase involved in cell wall biosynthesis